MTNFYDQFYCDKCNEYSIVIDDDGRVCYAYLLSNKKIIGDVWLYNKSQAPMHTDWNNKNEMPFLNPIEFVLSGNEIPVATQNRDIIIVCCG